jgi:transcription elongation factor Elf1
MTAVALAREYRRAAVTTGEWARTHALTCPHCGSDQWNITLVGRRTIDALCETCRQPFELDEASALATVRRLHPTLNERT